MRTGLFFCLAGVAGPISWLWQSIINQPLDINSVFIINGFSHCLGNHILITDDLKINFTVHCMFLNQLLLFIFLYILNSISPKLTFKFLFLHVSFFLEMTRRLKRISWGLILRSELQANKILSYIRIFKQLWQRYSSLKLLVRSYFQFELPLNYRRKKRNSLHASSPVLLWMIG